jgi:hypothetical protein
MAGLQTTGFNAVDAGLGASYRLARNSKYRYVNFADGGRVIYTDAVGAAASVSDAGINLLVAPNGTVFEVRLEQAFAGAAPQVLQGTTAIPGLLFVLDAADNDGIAMSLGNGASGSETPNPGSFKIDTDAAFFLRVKLAIADVSDADEVSVGFTSLGYSATGEINDGTDFAFLNVDNGDIFTETRLNNGTATRVDTTQNVADAGVVTLEVRVDGAGNVRFFVDGKAPTTDAAAFVFDTTDTVYAQFQILNDFAGDPGVTLKEWESGYISSRGLETIHDLG